MSPARPAARTCGALVLVLVLACAACRSAADRPGGGAQIQAMLDQAKAEHRRELVIPPGTYRLPQPTDGAGSHLRLAGVEDLTIIADGVTIEVPDPGKAALIIERCARVELRGATFVRPGMIHSQGTLVAIDAARRWIDIRVAAGYPQDLDDPKAFSRIPVINLFDPGERRWKAGVPDIYIDRVERLGPGLFRFVTRDAAGLAGMPIAVGDRAAWRGLGGRGHDIALRWTEAVTLRRVTIRNGAGMCFQELCGKGGNRYDGCAITYGDRPAGASEDPLLASSVDGLHSSGMRTGPTVTGCRFEGLDDDGIAIHGLYAIVVAAEGGRLVVDARPIHGGTPPSAFCAAGDRLRLLGPEMTLAGEPIAVSTRALPDFRPDAYPVTRARLFQNRAAASYLEIALDRPVPAGLVPGCYLENADAIGEGFAVRDSLIRSKRAHGMFIKAGRGTIEGNLVEENLMGAIVVAPEVNAWTESGFARDLTIRGNTIRRCGLGTQDWNGGITVAAYEDGRFLPLPGGHRDIRILDNRFEDNDGTQLVLSSIRGLTVAGNHFIRPMRQEVAPTPGSGVDRRALAWITACDGISASANLAEDAGPAMERLVAGGDGEAQRLGEGFARGP